MTQAVQTPQAQDTRSGLAYAIAAYSLWGFLPIYLKLVSYMPVAEIVAHRILWSVPVAGAVLVVTGRTRDLREALMSRRMLGMGLLTAALISVNWGLYVWAVTAERTVDAALGYYINPLFSIFLARVVLGERLTRLQWGAVGLATLAVAVLTIATGSLPWVAVGVTLSWGFYALCKRQLPIGPNQGFMLEVLILSVPSLACVMWLGAAGEGHFGASWPDTGLLLLGGLITAAPLLLYANGAKQLRLSTIGILQYIAPTLILLVAVFLFGEPFGSARAVAFPLIWAALALYSWSLISQARRKSHS